MTTPELNETPKASASELLAAWVVRTAARVAVCMPK